MKVIPEELSFYRLSSWSILKSIKRCIVKLFQLSLKNWVFSSRLKNFWKLLGGSSALTVTSKADFSKKWKKEFDFTNFYHNFFMTNDMKYQLCSIDRVYNKLYSHAILNNWRPIWTELFNSNWITSWGDGVHK